MSATFKTEDENKHWASDLSDDPMEQEILDEISELTAEDVDAVWMDRDQPYSIDEKRISDFIQEMTDGNVGSGVDPIGFIIASYKYLSGERQRLEHENVCLKERLKAIGEISVKIDVDQIVCDLDEIFKIARLSGAYDRSSEENGSD